MKIILTYLMICVITFTYGQKNENLGKSFVMTQNYSAKKCNAVGENLRESSDPLERTFIIVVEALTDTGYVVSVPKFTQTDRPELNEKFVMRPSESKDTVVGNKSYSATQEGRKIYFLIPLSDFDNVCKKATSRHSFTVGIPTIPAKLRFGNGGTGEDPRYFNFEGNLSLGLSGGYKYSFGVNRKFAFIGLIGFSIASVDVDSLTTKGKELSNIAAASFSPHIGIVFDFQGFQFGLYSGFDFLQGELNSYWVYRNQPWLGLGISYNLFKTEKMKDSN